MASLVWKPERVSSSRKFWIGKIGNWKIAFPDDFFRHFGQRGVRLGDQSFTVDSFCDFRCREKWPFLEAYGDKFWPILVKMGVVWGSLSTDKEFLRKILEISASRSVEAKWPETLKTLSSFSWKTGCEPFRVKNDQKMGLIPLLSLDLYRERGFGPKWGHFEVIPETLHVFGFGHLVVSFGVINDLFLGVKMVNFWIFIDPQRVFHF